MILPLTTIQIKQFIQWSSCQISINLSLMLIFLTESHHFLIRRRPHPYLVHRLIMIRTPIQNIICIHSGHWLFMVMFCLLRFLILLDRFWSSECRVFVLTALTLWSIKFWVWLMVFNNKIILHLIFINVMIGHSSNKWC